MHNLNLGQLSIRCFTVVAFATLALACDSKESGTAGETKAQGSEAAEKAKPAADQPAAASAKKQVVEVAKAGTKFDPPVNASQVPDGAWMCDMGGSVHYASMDEGDGKCPTCGMALVHKGAAEPEGSGGSAHGH